MRTPMVALECAIGSGKINRVARPRIAQPGQAVPLSRRENRDGRRRAKA